MSGISVLLVNWNSRDDLVRCLESLAAQTDRDFEVVVVDNGSTDGSCETVRRDFREVVLVEAGENLGFAEGCNRGIAASRGEWVATLNNDATAHPGWIAELRAATRSGGPRLGMIQSRILFDRPPHDTNSTGVLMFDNGTFVDRDFGRPSDGATASQEVFCVSAGAALYRRSMLEEVRLASGVFDRTFFMYFEDVDLGWRCRLAGWDALYLPSAVVYHRFHGSSSRRGRHFVALHCYRNRVRTLLKNASLPRLAFTTPLTAYDFARTLYFGGAGALVPFLRAFVDGLGQRAEVDRKLHTSRTAIEKRWASPKPRRSS